MTLVGYVSLSAGGEDPAMQRDALAAVSCVKICSETASGALHERPEIARLLE